MSDWGTRLSEWSARYTFATVCQSLGLRPAQKFHRYGRGPRIHDLRHTFATLLIYEGRTLNEVAEHLGHADPSFTARVYTHVLRDAVRRRRVPIEEAITKARRSLRAQR